MGGQRIFDVHLWAVPASRIVAVIAQPRVGGRMDQRRRIEPLRGRDGSARHKQRQHPHFTVSRYASMLCISESVYFVRSARWAARGSFTSTFTVSRGQE